MKLLHNTGVFAFLALLTLTAVNANEVVLSKTELGSTQYKVLPGDILEISVWKEEEMLKEVIVRPDGRASFPLVGDFLAAGLTLPEITQTITEALSQYIVEPVVTVAAKQLLGNKIYVIGKVTRPGEYATKTDIDVVQALSMAGGMTPFASYNDILILRRDAQGKQQVFEFSYGDIEDGDDLEQNILLKAGDIVIVP